MPNRYELKVSAGALSLRRHWESDGGAKLRPPLGGAGSRAGMPGVSTAGRVSMTWSQRSRRHMRFEFSALPWELLGARPAMITLTYPGDWQLYVPNSEILGRHRERFKERWRKKFGAQSASGLSSSSVVVHHTSTCTWGFPIRSPTRTMARCNSGL